MQKGRKITRKLKKMARRRWFQHVTIVACSGAILSVLGCTRAPSFNILGSFFPSWLLCGIVGILLAAAARLFFVRIKLEEQLTPLILVYPCLAAFFTFTLWLLFFS